VCGGSALGAFTTRVAGEVFQPTAKLAFPSSFFSPLAPQRPQRLLTNAISAPLALARTGDPSPHTPNPHRPHPPPTLNPAHFPLLAPRTTHHAPRIMAPTPQSRSSQELINVKLLLIGNSSVGKSSLLLRFSDKQWLPEDEASATIGVDFRVRSQPPSFFLISFLFIIVDVGMLLYVRYTSWRFRDGRSR
jgi:hypothetical protein